MTNFVNSGGHTTAAFVFSGFNSGGVNNLINSGTISPGAFVLDSGSTLTGNIENFGSIAGGIIVNDSTIKGQILDSAGTISGGINLVDATMSGSVGNEGAIDVFSGFVTGGINVDAQSLIAAEAGDGVVIGYVTNFTSFVSHSAAASSTAEPSWFPAPATASSRLRVSTFSGAIVNAA